jgi:hypothetical protein
MIPWYWLLIEPPLIILIVAAISWVFLWKTTGATPDNTQENNHEKMEGELYDRENR